MTGELKQFEGRCRYCGESDFVFAETQGQADKAVTEKCECEGYIEIRRYEDALYAVNKILSQEPVLDEDLKKGIRLMVKSVISGEITGCSIKTSWETIIIKSKKNMIAVIRRETKDREVLA